VRAGCLRVTSVGIRRAALCRRPVSRRPHDGRLPVPSWRRRSRMWRADAARHHDVQRRPQRVAPLGIICRALASHGDPHDNVSAHAATARSIRHAR
jgi:hypothetical protein